MYKCEICQQTVPPRTKAFRIVVETRFKRYPYREEVIPAIVKGKFELLDDPGGMGREIVREVLTCPDCAARHCAS